METIFQNEVTPSLREIPLWVFTTGGLPATGVTINAGELLISKSGGVEQNAAGTWFERNGGFYSYTATAAEVDSLGDITLRLNKSGFKPTCNIVSIVPNTADIILKRDFSEVTGEAERSLLNSARKNMNKIALVGDTLSIYKENDTTVAFTQTVTTSPLAEPLTELDTD